ncbi:RNA-guided endonuclease IscB [Streptomyces sp. NPDC048277]|uniref:RNA-guided endonuclease IscB n=1 Tax=Streptomyces sp. NPDC048277 TaxID=3155027 RepID=UPI0033F4F636
MSRGVITLVASHVPWPDGQSRPTRDQLSVTSTSQLTSRRRPKLATFHAGQETHQAVLPQRPALEFESADTPGNKDETGLEGREAPGVGHVRGEIISGSPAADGVTPAREGREQGREVHTTNPVVFVLDRHGIPLQPTSPARARRLLRSGRAVVHRHTPFVIRLKDRTAGASQVDGVELGIDPGSRHTGIAVVTTKDGNRRGLYHVELTHRSMQIRDKLTQRAGYRRGRRTRNLRHRAPRFSNRGRSDGWLAPSLRHRVDTTMAWSRRLARWAPVEAVHVELAAFDTHAISAGRPLEDVEYQHGTLHGTEVREYLLAKWGRACAYCDAKGVPLSVDHIEPRSRGGSDRISNLTLACVPCNQAKDNHSVEDFLKHRPRILARVLAQTKTPLRDAAAVNATRWALWRALDAEFSGRVRGASGGRTKWNRQCANLPKSHTLDALCVGRFDTIDQYPADVLAVAATGRGTYARTRTNASGFPRLRLPRQKRFHGFATGDLVRAIVPKGRKAGTHKGRVAVRARGTFTIRTAYGLITDIHHRHVHLLQRADGYAYITTKEAARACRSEGNVPA